MVRTWSDSVLGGSHGAIVRVSVDGGTPETLATGTMYGNLAIDATSVYFQDGQKSDETHAAMNIPAEASLTRRTASMGSRRVGRANALERP